MTSASQKLAEDPAEEGQQKKADGCEEPAGGVQAAVQAGADPAEEGQRVQRKRKRGGKSGKDTQSIEEQAEEPAGEQSKGGKGTSKGKCKDGPIFETDDGELKVSIKKDRKDNLIWLFDQKHKDAKGCLFKLVLKTISIFYLFQNANFKNHV